MASIAELKQRIDLHDLAGKLGLDRPQSTGNYRSPHHKDKVPSLSIYGDGRKWKDHSGDAGGDCVSLVQYVENCSPGDAMRRLHELYSIAPDLPSAPKRELTKIEYIVKQCREHVRGAFEYLQGRGIAPAALERAVASGALGYNTWCSPNKAIGTAGYGGPGAAFVCRDWHTGEAVAVDFRYLNPDHNGGQKTGSHGVKEGVPWFLDRKALVKAHTVVVVESAINALAVESLERPGLAALAIRGTGTWRSIDWRILRGKLVLLALDADEPDKYGYRPGDKAAWAIYEVLTRLDIAVLMVDKTSWYEDGFNDLADIAKAKGLEDLRSRLEVFEPWAVQGLPGKDGPVGKSRVVLPAHDWSVYWRFRCRPDFTSYISKVEEDGDGGPDKLKFEDVAGFRVAAISRVSIASAAATMSGEDDAQPNVVFAVSVQAPRHGPLLQRRVLVDERLHNVEYWKKLGPIYQPARFLRLINILERTADCGATDAVNFVGLAWRHGKLIVNEGPDCFFSEPEKQCPYHNLVFPSGPKSSAAEVIQAYQRTFAANAASLVLVWGLGGHLKALLGYWPHCIMQSAKGSGKSTFVKRLERTLGMTMFGGQSLQTEFRLLTSISHTSHPIGWEEISARKTEIIDKAIAILQEAYQYTITRRGSEMTEYLTCAPVLLAGEDVPARSLTGKVIRTDLTRRKGEQMRANLPRFPVREWLQYLTTLDRDEVLAANGKWHTWLQRVCRSPESDEGAARMRWNYAALLTAWGLLCDFAGLATETGDFATDIRTAMNSHIAESKADREPWVWIMDAVLMEIEGKKYSYPWRVDVVNGEECLLIEPRHVMGHIASSMALREVWNGLPVKSARVFRSQLAHAEIIVKEEVDRVIDGRRHSHLAALSLKRLAEYGLHVSTYVTAREAP